MFQKIPRKFALKNRKMPVFSIDFYTIFSILYHFDTVLGGFMGSGGGGGGVTPRIPMELCGGVFFCQTRRESNQGRLKVRFLDVLNPGL